MQYCVLVDYPAISTITWVTASASVWIFCIFMGQMGLIASETTTYEVSSRNVCCILTIFTVLNVIGAQVMKFKNNGVDGFSWRGLRNVINFFCTGAYAVSSAAVASNGAAPSECATTSKLQQQACCAHANNNSSDNNSFFASENSKRINNFSLHPV